MISSGIQAISIFADDGTVFQFNGEAVDVDSPTVNAITRNSGRGTLKKISQSFDYTLRHDDEDLHAQLEAADHSSLKWRLAVAGFNSMFFVLDKASFVPEPTPQFDPASEDYPFQVRYVLNAGTQIAQGINGLQSYQKSQGRQTFNDTTDNGEADGFTNNGVETTTFSGGVQALNNSTGAGSFYIDIPFPFEGLTVAQAAEYTLTSGTPDMVLRYLDDGGATLASFAQSISGSRVSASGESPANSFTARMILAESGSAYELTVKEPSLRVDGKTDWTDY